MARKVSYTAPILAFGLVASTWFLVRAAEAPALPKDIAPLAPELAKKIEELKRAAEDYRGLPFKEPVPCGSFEREVLKKKMLEAIQEELPPQKMAGLEAGLKAFGLIPQDMVLSKYLPDLLASQVGGFYDPKRKYLAILNGAGGMLGQAAKDQLPPGMGDRMDEVALVHELTHAIQDQHFDLEKFEAGEPLSDQGAARTALIEGDATLVMYDFFSKMRLESLPGVDTLMNQLFKDPKQILSMLPDMPGSKELAAAPAWLRDNLLFSYLQGFSFCISVRKVGGQKLLDYAFSKDPPRSTEQILHPEKWHTQRDDPTVIAWPDLSLELPGYKKLCEGTLGEQSIKILLREGLKDKELPATSAAGWGGDRFAVYAKDQNSILLWITEWDSTQASRAFKDAATALAPGWNIASPSPTRVVVIRGRLEPEELARVGAKLAEAKAQAPENKNIDLAALGIARGENQGGGMLKALEGILEGKEELDFAKLLNDPDIQKAAAQIATQLGDDKAGGQDAGQAQVNPQKLLEMFSQKQPPGQLSADGLSYTNEKLGFKMAIPAAQKDWRIEPKPPAPVSVLISSPGNSVQVSVVSQPLPIALPIENMGPMLEMGQKMAMQNYKKLSQSVIQTSGRKGLELQCEGDNAGQHLRSTGRFYIVNGSMIALSAVTSPEDWAKNEKAINEVLGGFSFIEAKDEQAKPPEKKEALKEE